MKLSELAYTYRRSFLNGLKAHVRRMLRKRQLRVIWMREGLKNSHHVVVAVVRNEKHRLGHLITYYRRLGFDHFIFVDNESRDGTEDMLLGYDDVSVIRATGDYKASRFGLDWVNEVLSKWCDSKWILHVDADEYLIYPNMETCDIAALTTGLERSEKRSLQCVMVDMYSEKDPHQNICNSDENPLDVCQLFDASGYNVSYFHPAQTSWIKGGVRHRIFFEHLASGPALNKTPLVLWKKHYAFLKSAHEVWPPSLNGGDWTRTKPLTGALLHFKFMQDFSEKLAEEETRNQHTVEYRAYIRSTSPRDSHLNFVGPHTKKFSDWRSLHECGLVYVGDDTDRDLV